MNDSTQAPTPAPQATDAGNELTELRKLRQVVDIIDELELDVFWNSGKALLCCNDAFFWGCADCEEITVEDIPSLRQAHADSKQFNGQLLFIARKRGERPQGAMYAHLEPEEWPLFDACGPERPSTLGNPIGTDGIQAHYDKKKAEKEAKKNPPVTAPIAPAALAAVKARAEAATPGPWQTFEDCVIEPLSTYRVAKFDPDGARFLHGDATYADMQFCAHARTDIPLLLTALASATAEATAAKAALGIQDGETIPEQPPQYGSILVDSKGGSRRRISPINDEVVRLERELTEATDALTTATAQIETLAAEVKEARKEKTDIEEQAQVAYRLFKEETDSLRTQLSVALAANAELAKALAKIAKDVLRIGVAESVGDAIKVARHVEATANTALEGASK